MWALQITTKTKAHVFGAKSLFIDKLSHPVYNHNIYYKKNIYYMNNKGSTVVLLKSEPNDKDRTSGPEDSDKDQCHTPPAETTDLRSSKNNP